MPQSFNTVEQVVKFVTMVIFTTSAQHAAVNSGQVRGQPSLHHSKKAKQ